MLGEDERRCNLQEDSFQSQKGCGSDAGEAGSIKAEAGTLMADTPISLASDIIAITYPKWCDGLGIFFSFSKSQTRSR